VREIGNQYSFGPSIMVTPVTSAGATNQSVYLPIANGPWYNFWTGATSPGGQRIDATAPVETLPLFVRPGSILPMGPLLQYSSEKPADPIELRIYPGASGKFTLYEDEGDGYNYEKKVYATIPLEWNEAKKALTIGKRSGNFPGMLKERTFHVVFVSPGHGIGNSETPADAVIHYDGKAVVVPQKK
jgi:alpha-D-xyloside xylohydrolase